MSKNIPKSSIRCKSEKSSIQKIQDDALKTAAFLVARDEMMRNAKNEETPVFDSPAVDSQASLDFQAPRTCNTGALISSVRIDWLEFTVKGADPVFLVPALLGLDWGVFTLLDYGMQGYPDQAQYGSVVVLWSEERPERGTKIILSSKALDQVAHDGVDIINMVLAQGGTFARIDCAMDDRSGATTIDTVIDAVNQMHDVNRFTQVEIRQPIDRRTRKYAGRSVYWGKASSSRQLVAYDKQLEQENQKSEYTGPWLRFEARWKKRAANVVALALCQNGLQSIPALIRGVVDFRENDNDQADRRTVCRWWGMLTRMARPIKTGVKKVVKTIEEKAAWLGRQMSKTIGQVAALMDGETILEMIRVGIAATTPAEWRLLDPEGKRVIFSGTRGFDCVIPF